MQTHLQTIPGTALQFEHYVPAKITSPYPILFNHGMFGGSWIFRLPMEYALRYGFEVYALNLEGHAPGQTVRISSIEDYVKNHIAMLKCIAKPTITVNHSMGGLIGLMATEELNRKDDRSSELIKAIVLLSSVVPGKFFPQKGMLRWRYLRAMATKKPFWPEQKHMVNLLLNHTPRREQNMFLSSFTQGSGMALRQVATSLLLVDERQIRCPTLVLAAGNDRIVSPAVQFQMAEKHKFKYDRIDGGDHMTFMWSVSPIQRIIKWCFPELDLEPCELCLKA